MGHSVRPLLIPALFLIVFVSAAFFAAELVRENENVREIINSLGVFGVVLVAMIAGLNVGLPIPAASFAPIFLAGGLSLTTIIIATTIGITVTDSINYFIGRYGRNFSQKHYPSMYERLKIMNERHKQWVLPGVFIYAAFIPFPNEVMLIPLGLFGYPYRQFIIPLLLGNIISQTILVLIFTNAYRLFF